VGGCRQKKQKETERHCENESETSESESETRSLEEKTLFHGIKWRHFDSVARSNIDWRTTGFSHGVMFGQGKS